ncbi:MAG TPA: TRAP transporter permease [Geminicoccus sp.]|nr:TRAP transporter permease [Geminicoccus sp.]HWL71034.1 TRAP transporter permease [Geminicoccus sp.]
MSGLAAGDDPGALAFGKGLAGGTIMAIALAFSAFQLWTAALSPLPSMVVRSVHVGFLLLLCFTLLAERGPGRSRLVGWALGIGGFVLGLYHWVFHDALILRAGDPTTTDLVVGVLVILLVFEASRRLLGLALPIICAVFLLYALFGEYAPRPLDHRPYDFAQVVDQMFLGTEGIYGTAIYVSSSFIFLFILFGSFLERAGMIRLFNDIAMGTVGHSQGGPAKVAVISSGLMGTINGSGVANVVTTGQFTIPLMKRFGYRPAFAGAVEATSSMGGQIMPPVMGAVAFIMAETIDVPYVEIAIAATIPAILYFATAFWVVHLEAGRHGLVGLPKSECPSALGALRRDWFLILPLAALVWLLFAGYTPMFAGTIGLALTALVVLGTPISQAIPRHALRILFWIAIGLGAAAFGRYGIGVIALLIVLLVLACLVVKGGRTTLLLCRDALADGARHALPVGIACALVGTIVGTLTLTGMASNFAGWIVDIGQNSLLLSLLLTMLACLVLGTGIPTIPNYIITSSIAGPALAELGVPLLVSHMFVFYFGIMADLTPPVALAALAASPIAGASHMRIGFTATRIAIAGYVVPFMAVYSPALMLQGDDYLATAYVVIKALVSIGLWGGATVGWLLGPLNWPERVFAAAAATLLVLALPVTDELGFGLSLLFLGWHWWRTRSRSVSRLAA